MLSTRFKFHGPLLVLSLSFTILISFFLFSTVVNVIQPIYALSDFNFAATGDWGCGSNTDNTVSNIVAKSPELVFGLGDYSYSSTGTCWFDRIEPIDSITRITIGNHEDDSSEGFSGYMSHFGLQQTYYSYNYENVHVLVLDTDRNVYPSGSPQYNFAVNDLQTASQNSGIGWIIVYFHKPMYASPGSCCDALGSFRDTYHPLFDQYGVDLVLQGHIHNYQRTFPLKYNSNSPSNPTITNNQPSVYTDPVGQIFAIAGAGGVGFHSLSGKASFVSSQQASSFGQLDIKITNNGNKLEGKFYRNSNNAILDTFSITKTAISSPLAQDQNVIVTKNIPKSINLTATDPNSDPLTYAVVTNPQNGILTGTAPNLTYNPNNNFVGTDSFTFKANDGTSDSNIATVTITVQDIPPPGNYNYAPSFVATGSNFNDTPDSASLRLNQFTVATWFKTSTDFASDAFIVNKGGAGSDSSGQNLNYGIWMTSTEKVKVGFETSSGADQYVTSVNSYNDGQWHYAVVTNDGTNVILYVDGVQAGIKATAGASPESIGTKPVRVGANSRVTPSTNFFTGEVDEVRIWNTALSASQVTAAFGGTFAPGHILHLPFDSQSLTGTYVYDPSLSLSGPP